MAVTREKTTPIALRLTTTEIERLRARTYDLSATVPGVARDLIRTGLAGGSNSALADRLMQVERRLAALEQTAQDCVGRSPRFRLCSLSLIKRHGGPRHSDPVRPPLWKAARGGFVAP